MNHDSCVDCAAYGTLDGVICFDETADATNAEKCEDTGAALAHAMNWNGRKKIITPVTV